MIWHLGLFWEVNFLGLMNFRPNKILALNNSFSLKVYYLKNNITKIKEKKWIRNVNKSEKQLITIKKRILLRKMHCNGWNLCKNGVFHITSSKFTPNHPISFCLNQKQVSVLKNWARNCLFGKQFVSAASAVAYLWQLGP